MALPSSWAVAEPAKEILRLNRCYSLLTSKRLSPSSPLANQVRNGSKTGTAACMEVFDSALLGANNQVSTNLMPNTGNPDGLLVLRRMQEFHRQFFKVKNYVNNLPVADSTPNVVDLFEGANFLTYTLLKSGTPYSQVANGTSSYRAIRTSTASPSRVLTIPSLPLALTQGTNEVPWTPSAYVPEGTLVGILPGVNSNIPAQMITEFTAFAGQNVNAHKGAGILGTQGYLLSNIAEYGNPDGASRTHRRWGANVMEDFLCRELPALRDADVAPPLLSPTSPMSFRKAVSCNRCHATQDPLAGTIRNQIRASTIKYGSYNVHFVGTRSASQPSAEVYPTQDDSNYYLRPPEGHLRYRSYDGTLVNQPLSGLADLGQKLAQGNDLYVCAAKKYYKFFTGVDVSLRDLGDLNSSPLTPGETFHRTNVVSLGLNLKNHQSLRTLIQEIVSSEAFVKPYLVQ